MASILIIDDDFAFRKVCRLKLEGAGYEVFEASNGRVGTELFQRKRPDLVFTDLIMPEKEGLETIKELRREFPDVKIVAISGSEKGYLSAARAMGASYTFSKPFEWKQVLDAIRDCLPIKEQNDA